VVDYDSARIGMVPLCCSKLDNLIHKLQGSFSLELKKSLLEDADEIRGSLLFIEVDKRLLADLDEVLLRICKDVGSPA
jgi:hypothetical protein